jgi:hypothetical protein
MGKQIIEGIEQEMMGMKQVVSRFYGMGIAQAVPCLRGRSEYEEKNDRYSGQKKNDGCRWNTRRAFPGDRWTHEKTSLNILQYSFFCKLIIEEKSKSNPLFGDEAS